MSWKSTGPPTQLEINDGQKIYYDSKAITIARIMNDYFVGKVQKIAQNLLQIPFDLTGCKSLMNGKKVSMSLNHVTVWKVWRILKSLKNETRSACDQLDNRAVMLEGLNSPSNQSIYFRFPRACVCSYTMRALLNNASDTNGVQKSALVYCDFLKEVR